MLLKGYKEDRWWYYGGKNRRPKPFQLSAKAGYFKYSEVITELLPGEYFKFFVNIRSINGISDFSNALEILVVKAGTNLSNANAWNFHYSHDNQTFDCFDRKLNGKYLKEIFPINLIKPLGQMNEIIIYYRPQSNNEKRGIYLIINNEYIKQGFFIGEKMKYSIYTRVVGMTADFYGK